MSPPTKRRPATPILGHIRAALAPGGGVLIVEQVILPGNDPFPGRLFDLTMLVMTEGGRQSTPDGYARLLVSADLQLERVSAAAGLSVAASLEQWVRQGLEQAEAVQGTGAEGAGSCSLRAGTCTIRPVQQWSAAPA